MVGALDGWVMGAFTCKLDLEISYKCYFCYIHELGDCVVLVNWSLNIQNRNSKTCVDNQRWHG